jgi:hypothetical protein
MAGNALTDGVYQVNHMVIYRRFDVGKRSGALRIFVNSTFKKACESGCLDSQGTAKILYKRHRPSLGLFI